ncbi:cytochrome c biogenesis protein ResB [bacterium]|nr:cytochrome c biogenesis protein ResB [bacterium]
MNLKKIETTLSSTKLTIWVLLLISVASIFGTLIPQNESIEFYRSVYGSKAGVITGLALNDTYHSSWFIALIALFAINLIACTTKKWTVFLRIMRHKPRDADAKTLKAMSIYHSWPVKTYKDTMTGEIHQAVRQIGLNLKIIGATSNGISFFAEKGKISRCGFFSVHAGILLILMGAVLTGFGFRGSMMLPEGETSSKVAIGQGDRSKNLDFQIRCDEFEMTTYQGTQRPKGYKSRLTIVEDGHDVLTRIIEVNRPLTYKGVTIYQASYGTIPDTDRIFLGIEPTDSSREAQRITVKLGEKTSLQGGEYHIIIDRLVPDFVMDKNCEVSSRTHVMRNPAISLSLYKNNEHISDQWLFLQQGSFHASRSGPWHFIFMGVSGKTYTGLQLTKSPGLWLIWLGGFCLTVGLFIIFFTSHERIWIKFKKEGNGGVITIAASSNRMTMFKSKMTGLIQAVEKITGILTTSERANSHE